MPVLDGLRGLAMLLVFLYHVVDPPQWRPPFTVGWIGIELFFVLSGFLITGLLLDSSGERRPLRTFYVRRALRILPLYYVVLAALYAAVWVSGRPQSARVLDDQPWFWLLQQNLLMALEGWYRPVHFAHFWSLALEVQFYLFWPPLLLALGARRALVACFVLATGSCVLRNALGLAWPFSYTATFTHLEGVMIGSALALLLRSRREWLGRAAPLVLLGTGIPLLVAGALGGLHIADEHVLRGAYPLLALFFGALLCSTFDTGRVGGTARALFTARPLLWIGKYSYGIYLTHWVIHLKLRRPLFAWLHPLVGSEAGAQLAAIAVQAVLAALLGVLGYHLIEMPFLRLKNVLAPRDGDDEPRLPEHELLRPA